MLVRVSTNKQDYQRQLTELQSYCEQRGFDVVHIIKSIVSGNASTKNREDIKELLTEAAKNKFGRVIVTEVSRLGRKPAQIRSTLNQLHELGVTVVFKQLAVESLDENGEETFVSSLIIGIYSEISSEETRVLSTRIKSGLTHAKKKGITLGRPVGTVEDNKSLLKKYNRVVKDLKSGISLRKLEIIHNISRTTICKIKRAAEVK